MKAIPGGGGGGCRPRCHLAPSIPEPPRPPPLPPPGGGGPMMPLPAMPARVSSIRSAHRDCKDIMQLTRNQTPLHLWYSLGWEAGEPTTAAVTQHRQSCKYHACFLNACIEKRGLLHEFAGSRCYFIVRGHLKLESHPSIMQARLAGGCTHQGGQMEVASWSHGPTGYCL